MDDWVTRLHSVPTSLRWGFLFSFSLSAWIIPVSLAAPGLAVALSLLAAIVGFIGAAYLCEVWKDEEKNKGKRYRLNQELSAYRFGLDEIREKQRLKNLYLAPAPEPEPILEEPEIETDHAEEEQPPTNGGEAIAQYWQVIIDYSQEKGWISAALLKANKRKFRPIKPEQIREWFLLLMNEGIGAIRGEGDRMEWCINPADFPAKPTDKPVTSD